MKTVNMKSINVHKLAAKLAKENPPGVTPCPMCSFGARDKKDYCCHTGRSGNGHTRGQ